MCADLSRFHGVADVSAMGSADFMAACDRLPYYDGAVTTAMRCAAEEARQHRPALTREQLGGVQYAGRDGWAPVFEVGEPVRG